MDTRGEQHRAPRIRSTDSNPGSFGVLPAEPSPSPRSLGATVDAAFRLPALRSARSWTAGGGLAVEPPPPQRGR